MSFIPYGSDDFDDPVKGYKISDLDSSGDIKYFGYIDKDARWYIMKLTEMTARYAKGDNGYDAAWGNRASLAYYNFEIIF
jgi:hypothetical protein